MATFDSAQRSQRTNRPVILYTITTLGATYRFTTNALDVTFGGVTYPALTAIHDDVQMSQDASGDELVVHLPISHPFVQRFAATGIPDQSVQVTVQELQTAASTAALTWSGPGQSLTVNGHTAALRVPAANNDALKIQLPTIAAQKICPHVLFDGNCAPLPGGDFPSGSASGTGGPVRLAFTASRNVLAVSADGLTITLDTLGVADGFYNFGKCSAVEFFGVSFAPPDETRTVLSQVGSVITIDMPFVVAPSDMVGKFASVEAGCDHTVTTCRDKFNNVANFGGFPQLNSSTNFWSPVGLGIQSS